MDTTPTKATNAADASEIWPSAFVAQATIARETVSGSALHLLAWHLWGLLTLALTQHVFAQMKEIM